MSMDTGTGMDTEMSAAIDAVPWDRLFHAYGPATNTPKHLHALLDGDAARLEAAVQHLFSAEIHQGTPWPSTASTARLVGRMLSGPLRSPDDEVRAGLLEFLRCVALAGDLGQDAAALRAKAYPEDDGAMADWLDRYLAADDEGQVAMWEDDRSIELGDLWYLRAAVDCHDAMPELLDAVTSLLDDAPPGGRAALAAAASVLVRHPDAADRRADLIGALSRAAADAEPDERAALVLAVGDAGGSPREFLTDPWFAVRVCAALAPALAEDREALAILRDAVASPRAFDLAFTVAPPQYTDIEPGQALIAAACERIEDVSVLAAGARAVAPSARYLGWECELGPLLRRIFAEGWPEREALTGGQRSVVAAVARSAKAWDPHDGNRMMVLKQFGLPNDREAWRALAEPMQISGHEGAKHFIVLEWPEPVQTRPERFGVGAKADDPRLPQALIDALRKAYQVEADEGLIDGFELRVDADLSFTLDVSGPAIPIGGTDDERTGLSLSSMLECIRTGPAIPARLAVTNAFCSRVSATSYRKGRARTRRFVLCEPIGPSVDAGPAERDGYSISFELDEDLLPVDRVSLLDASS